MRKIDVKLKLFVPERKKSNGGKKEMQSENCQLSVI